MKDVDDMEIGESFYLKQTVVTISTRTGKPCEFDEERIDINDLIIEELEKIKAKIEKENEPYITMWETGFDDVSYGKYRAYRKTIGFIVKRIDELKGE